VLAFVGWRLILWVVMGLHGPALVVISVLWYHVSVVKELIKKIKTYPRWPLLAVDGRRWPEWLSLAWVGFYRLVLTCISLRSPLLVTIGLHGCSCTR
jgi:hypothetical protein